jgi:carbon storage regulator
MLVLSRHRDESVIIGDQLVTVTIVDIQGDKVKLGFDAARDVPIHRREVFDAIRHQRRAAAEYLSERLNVPGGPPPPVGATWTADVVLAWADEDPDCAAGLQGAMDYLRERGGDAA